VNEIITECFQEIRRLKQAVEARDKALQAEHEAHQATAIDLASEVVARQKAQKELREIESIVNRNCPKRHVSTCSKIEWIAEQWSKRDADYEDQKDLAEMRGSVITGQADVIKEINSIADAALLDTEDLTAPEKVKILADAYATQSGIRASRKVMQEVHEILGPGSPFLRTKARKVMAAKKQVEQELEAAREVLRELREILNAPENGDIRKSAEQLVEENSELQSQNSVLAQHHANQAKTIMGVLRELPNESEGSVVDRVAALQRKADDLFAECERQTGFIKDQRDTIQEVYHLVRQQDGVSVVEKVQSLLDDTYVQDYNDACKAMEPYYPCTVSLADRVRMLGEQLDKIDASLKGIDNEANCTHAESVQVLVDTYHELIQIMPREEVDFGEGDLTELAQAYVKSRKFWRDQGMAIRDIINDCAGYKIARIQALFN
jgi:hypothetical protein